MVVMWEFKFQGNGGTGIHTIFVVPSVEAMITWQQSHPGRGDVMTASSSVTISFKYHPDVNRRNIFKSYTEE